MIWSVTIRTIDCIFISVMFNWSCTLLLRLSRWRMLTANWRSSRTTWAGVLLESISWWLVFLFWQFISFIFGACPHDSFQFRDLSLEISGHLYQLGERQMLGASRWSNSYGPFIVGYFSRNGGWQCREKMGPQLWSTFLLWLGIPHTHHEVFKPHTIHIICLRRL